MSKARVMGFALILLVTLCLGDVIDFAGDGRYVGATGPWAFRVNPAGIVENEFRQLLMANTMRFGTNNLRSFSVALIEPAKDTLAGVLQLSSDFGDLGQRLSFLYGIAGKVGSTALGVNIGIERITDTGKPEIYSVFVDLGTKGKFVEDSYVYYSLAVKKFRVWSSDSGFNLMADVGGGVSLEFNEMKFSFDVMYVSNEFWNFAPGTQLHLEPVSLYFTVPFFYQPSLSKGALSMDFGGNVKIGNFDIGVSIYYPFSKLSGFDDPFKEPEYDWHIDFRLGVKW